MKLRSIAGAMTLLAIAATVTAPAASAATAPDLASAVLTDASVITGSQLVTDGSGGASSMVATTELAGFPREGDSFAILSSGNASDAYSMVEGTKSGDFGGGSRGSGNDRDVTVLRIDVVVPPTANCMLGVDFRFLSEEYPSYVGQGYNDAFIAEVDSSTWTASGTSVDAPRNFAFDPSGNPISINAAGPASMSAANAAGTTYGGATQVLTAGTPLTPGPHSLFFSIFDQGDNGFDSTVLIDNLRIGTVANVATDCQKGATSAPANPQVTPAPVTFSDVYGAADDTYTIPTSSNVTYTVDGVTQAAGTYPGSGTVTVDAVADLDYVLDGISTFTHTFTDVRTESQTSTGSGTSDQAATATLPVGGVITLLDQDGEPATTVVSPGHGTYVLDAATGVITFTPELGYSGSSDSVVYQVTDSHGDVSTSTYTPDVAKPAGPVPSGLTSQDDGDTAQSVTVPGGSGGTGGTVSLVDSEGTSVPSVTVAGQGSYAVDAGTGVITFSPADCFAGVAEPVTYRVTDAYGQTADETYTPTVNAPAAPTAVNLTSSGIGSAHQSATADADGCSTVTLLDDASHPTTTVTRAGQGTWTLDTASHVVTFVPVAGYHGTAAPVGYRITDSQDRTAEAAYTVTVNSPAGPSAPSRTSSGTGTAPQSVVVPVPVGGTVSLLDTHGDPTTSVAVTGVGTYALDAATGTITFVPAAGFHGTPAGVTYEVVDLYGQPSTSTYRPTVRTPAAPVAPAVVSTGGSGAAQQVAVTQPVGGTVTLIDGHGKPTTTVTVPGEGTYRLNPTTGTITFTPVAGFSGQTHGVTYQLTDSYGQKAKGTFRPTVKAAAVKAPRPSLTVAHRVVRSASVPVTCRVTTGNIGRCRVTAYAVVNGDQTRIGYGSKTIGGSGTKGRTAVNVKLNALGRSMAARPGGVRTLLKATVRPTATRNELPATRRTVVVAPQVRLRTVYFAPDSAGLRSVDRAYLKRVRSQLAGVKQITCMGYADAQSTSRYNKKLGTARASAACSALAKGLHIKVVVVSRGESRPAAKNTTYHGRTLNRRGEIILKY